MYWYGNGMGGWGYALMVISWLLFWALVVIAIVMLVRYLRRPQERPPGPGSPPGDVGRPPQPGGSTAEQLLAERFARGDIDEAEYRRRLTTLREVSAGQPGHRE